MPEELIRFTLNGKPAEACAHSTVAAALLSLGVTSFRRSMTGDSRAPLCGMGICFECRVTINGRPHQKSCQIPLASGMEVSTDE